MDSAACNDILENQFCLLPKTDTSNQGGRIDRIGKVIVCGSPLLESYRLDPFSASYIAEIKAVYSECLPLDDMSFRHQLLSRVVVPHSTHPSFHHVLTELAFLELRREHNPTQHGIVLVSLDDSPMAYLAFTEPTNLRLKYGSFAPSDLHRRFFKLLRLIFTEKHVALGLFEAAYDKISTWLDRCQDTIDLIEVNDQVDKMLRHARQDLTDHENAQLRALERKFQIVELGQAGFTELEKERNAFLGNLATIPNPDRKNLNPDRAAGTCEWFKNHSLFLSWRNGTGSPLLWVSALPGCGKSVLFRYLVDDVLVAPSRTICYFFFKDIGDQRSATDALRCLLHQVLFQLPDLLSKAILQRFAHDGKLVESFDGLWTAFTDVAKTIVDGEIVCVIDALDECQSDERLRLVKKLAEWSKDTPAVLKIIVPSRLYTDVSREFHEVQAQIHLSGEDDLEVEQISKEIDLVIQARLQTMASRLRLPTLQHQALRQKLTETPQKTYLWAYLVLEELGTTLETDEKSLRQIIEKLPGTVEDAHNKILNRDGRPERVTKLLSLIVAAREPLTLGQLAEIWSLEHNTQLYRDLDVMTEAQTTETVRGLCGLFVVISEGKLFLLHQTASEFLVSYHEHCTTQAQRPGYRTWERSISHRKSKLDLALACVRFLALPDAPFPKQYETGPGSSVDAHDSQRFALYACRNVLSHLHEAASSLGIGDHAQIQRMWEVWKSAKNHIKSGVFSKTCFPQLSSLLILASWVGAHHPVEELLRMSETQIDYKDSVYGRSARHWAVRGRSLIVVKLLLDAGAKCDNPDAQGYTPLALTASSPSGGLAVAALLLEKDSMPNTWNARSYSPLQITIQNYKFNVAALLLRRGADPSTAPALSESALYFLSWCSDDDHSRRPLKPMLMLGADVNAKSSNGSTVLDFALIMSHEQIATLLIVNGEAVAHPLGALMLARKLGQAEFVASLLSNNMRTALDMTYDLGQRLLREAVAAGDMELAQVFVSHGAYPHDVEANKIAQETGRLNILQMLNKGSG